MTLVELMVALVIGLVVSLAAVTSLVVTRQGFSSADAASQLRDNSRFAADLIQRIALQSGFKDTSFVAVAPSQQDQADDAAGNIASNITGFNNKLFDSSSLSVQPTVSTFNGSDVLILRYQAVQLNGDLASTVADMSMIDCSGNTVTTVPANRNDRLVSIFHIAADADGEPALMCSRSATGAPPFTTQTLVRGVEDFQVLYGIDGFTSANAAFTNTADSVPERYVRADQIVVGSNTASQATYNNWRRVRSIRIGMVLRAAVGSQQDRVVQTLYPFGLAKDSSTGAAGAAMSSTNDTGSAFSAPADGRLRQVYTFTIHLRNDQAL
jgi:type IV pilus assembly protein PilW